MSTVVRFLESLGSRTTVSDYAAAVSDLAVGAEQRSALLDRNVDLLAELLGARGDMRCLIYSGEPN